MRKLDESTLMSIRERRGEIESTSHRGAAHAINGGGDDEMEDAVSRSLARSLARSLSLARFLNLLCVVI